MRRADRGPCAASSRALAPGGRAFAAVTRAGLACIGPARAGRACIGLALSALALGALAQGCGEDGRAPYAGLTRFESASRLFRVYYLAPPWTVESAEGDALRLRIDYVVGTDAGRPPKYVFAATVAPGASTEAYVRARVRDATARGDTMEGAVEAFTTRSGDRGHWATTREPVTSRWTRHVAIALGAGAPGEGRVLAVQVETNVDPRVPELDAMIRDVDARPLE